MHKTSVSLATLTVALLCTLTYAQTESPPPDSSATDSGSLASSYKQAAERIIQATLSHNEAYTKLSELCDDIGPRLSGSSQLDKALGWAVQSLKQDGQVNVHLEPVEVTHWVRGSETLTMVQPRVAPLSMLGLGGSVGTPPDGITARVLVVRDKEELDAVGEAARGKIVLFNFPMPPYSLEEGSHYGRTVRYRGSGATWAAEKGAVACLVRSVTANSLRTPHTGAMRYGDSAERIPTAAVSIEDAQMLARMQERNVPVTVTLKMEAKTLGKAQSANVIAELRGTEKPDEVVVIGGHIDSWDVGQGAHDDGAGCVMAMEAVNVLRKLNMIPRRTIRVVLWTNEENGLAGGKQYAEDHADELVRHVAAIEADSGAFAPTGYSLECSNKSREAVAAQQIRDIAALLEPLGAGDVRIGGSGADISPMRKLGVVLLGHRTDGSKYFDYHHSPADTVDKVDPGDLSKNVAAIAVLAYVIADMPERLGGPLNP